MSSDSGIRNRVLARLFLTMSVLASNSLAHAVGSTVLDVDDSPVPHEVLNTTTASAEKPANNAGGVDDLSPFIALPLTSAHRHNPLNQYQIYEWPLKNPAISPEPEIAPQIMPLEAKPTAKPVVRKPPPPAVAKPTQLAVVAAEPEPAVPAVVNDASSQVPRRPKTRRSPRRLRGAV